MDGIIHTAPLAGFETPTAETLAIKELSISLTDD